MAKGTEPLLARLRRLVDGSPDIEAAALLSVDGMIIAAVLPPGVEADRVSAMSAPLLALGARMAAELGRGALDEVYVRGRQGYVLLMAVGADAVLTGLARKGAPLGLVLYELRRAAADLTGLL